MTSVLIRTAVFEHRYIQREGCHVKTHTEGRQVTLSQDVEQPELAVGRGKEEVTLQVSEEPQPADSLILDLLPAEL